MEDPCVAKVLQAARAEGEAVKLDRDGDAAAAASQYEASRQLFTEAIELAQASHLADVPALTQHARELEERASYLRGLGGAPAVPVEQHVRQVQLRMRSPAAGVAEPEGGAAEPQTLAAAAAVGALGGAITLGMLAGAPITGALAGAAGLGYAALQPNGVGDATRGVGEKAAAAVGSAASKAREVDQQYGVSEKAAAGAQRVSEQAKATGAALAEAQGRGREARGAPASDGYRFGDLTRGLVANGKEARGAGASQGYKFGDFSRGVAATLRAGGARAPPAQPAPAPQGGSGAPAA